MSIKVNLFLLIYLNYSDILPNVVIAYISITLIIVLRFDVACWGLSGIASVFCQNSTI